MNVLGLLEEVPGSTWREPGQTQGEPANCTRKDPREELSPRPSDCEVLTNLNVCGKFPDVLTNNICCLGNKMVRF